jgi:aldehyde:ferredoxin oxidoreductase
MGNLYGGTILRINLTDSEIKRQPTSDYADKYIGGRGINIRILYEEMGKDIQPLDPENIIIFGVGPLSGTMFPGSSRVDVMTRSPVTNLIGNANFGGDWGAEFKYAGYDHLVLSGKAEKPVYIYIENDVVEIRDAAFLWGKPIYELNAVLRKELEDEEVKIVGIGPAGENRVTIAALQTNIGNSGARTGLGCILGSKNVKAIAVRGTNGVKVADPENFFKACTRAHTDLKNSDYYEEVSQIGVMDAEYAYVLSGIEAAGDAHKTAQNFDPEGKTDFRKFWDKYGIGRTGCFGCPVHCMENFDVPNLGGAVISCEVYPQLSWEVRNDDMLLWYECVKICQNYGIDNTSIAITLQWLMELYEMGMLPEEITDGIAMKWGDRDAILGMLKKTIRREGFGDIIADGMKATSRYLDEKIPAEKRKNKSTYEFAMQVNNNPMYGINPRFNSMALTYSIGRRSDGITDIDNIQFYIVCLPGYPNYTEEERQEKIAEKYLKAERLSGGIKDAGDPYSYEGKAELVIDAAWITTLADMMVTCKWHTKWLSMDVNEGHYAEALTHGLGKEITTEDLIKASRRIKALERAYENILGRTREHDMIPEKEFDNPVTRGHWKGYTLDREKYEKMKEKYYALIGWHKKTGIVEQTTLEELGLEEVSEKMKSLGLF